MAADSQRLWLVRHGETAWSKSGRHTGSNDIPLIEEGRLAAALVGRELSRSHFTAVFSSPLGRALETCRIAGFGAQVELLDVLREWNYGEFEGLTSAHIRQRIPGWTVWSGGCPGGEDVQAVARRADLALARFATIAGDVLVFSHGHLLRVLAARWIGLCAEHGRLLALSTGSISILGHERETRVVQSWNQVLHENPRARVPSD